VPAPRWTAVAAGVSAALALHVCLGLFGAALGFTAESASSRALGAIAALWALGSAFIASCAGAILAARMVADDDRTAMLHGLLVWCVALVLGALLLSGTVAGGAMGAGYLWNGGVVPNESGRDAGPGAAIDSATRNAAAGSLLGGFATLAGLGGAIFGARIARRPLGIRPARPTRETSVRDTAPVRNDEPYAPGMMPPPAERRRDTQDDTVWTDPAFDRRHGAVVDRRRH
jgi:hypothetical protein